MTVLCSIVLAAACAERQPPLPQPSSQPQPQPQKQPQSQLQPQPVTEQPVFMQIGMASWYGRVHQGQATASGEAFDMRQLTAAHRTLPFGTIVRVTNAETQQTVKVRINDRGPYTENRVIDLSARAARELGIMADGVAPVRIEQYASDQSMAR